MKLEASVHSAKCAIEDTTMATTKTFLQKEDGEKIAIALGKKRFRLKSRIIVRHSGDTFYPANYYC